MKPKPATRAPRNSKRSHRFSLVSAEAQQQMYRAIRAMGSANGGGAQGWSELSGTPGSQEQSGGGPGAPAVGVLGWSGAEIAEIAVCLAAGESCPLVLACPAPGARLVSDGARVIGGSGRRLTSATLAAMDALLTRSLNSSPDQEAPTQEAPNKAAGGVTPENNARGRNGLKKPKAHPREDAAIVCAGLLDAGAEAERDYRAAFRFAARHKLPILYVVASRLRPGQGAPLHPSKPTTGLPGTPPLHPSKPTTGLPGTPPLDLRSIYPEFGVPLFTVDANDAIAAYRVATEALYNARHLRGPSVIEALMLPHSSAAANHALELLTAYMQRHGNPPQNS